MIDTHSHINSEIFEDDLSQVIKTANEAGVTKIIAVGCDIYSNNLALEIAQKYNNIYPTVGIHPLNIDEDYDFCEVLKKNKVYAIGECGLDYHYNSDNKEKQKEVFIKQIKLAVDYDLPLIVHTRESFLDTYKCLRPFKGKVRGVFHCFSGNMEDAQMAIELGFLLGIGGVITYKSAQELKKIVSEYALLNFVLETDSPYLAPVPLRSKRNEPSFLKYIIKEIAFLKNMKVEEVDRITSRNAIKLFRLEDQK